MQKYLSTLQSLTCQKFQESAPRRSKLCKVSCVRNFRKVLLDNLSCCKVSSAGTNHSSLEPFSFFSLQSLLDFQFIYFFICVLCNNLSLGLPVSVCVFLITVWNRLGMFRKGMLNCPNQGTISIIGYRCLEWFVVMYKFGLSFSVLSPAQFSIF